MQALLNPRPSIVQKNNYGPGIVFLDEEVLKEYLE
jgi:hypothetical protein